MEVHLILRVYVFINTSQAIIFSYFKSIQLQYNGIIVCRQYLIKILQKKVKRDEMRGSVLCEIQWNAISVQACNFFINTQVWLWLFSLFAIEVHQCERKWGVKWRRKIYSTRQWGFNLLMKIYDLMIFFKRA